MILFIDGETTIHNKGHPFDGRNFLVSYAYYTGTGSPVFKYYTDPDFAAVLGKTLSQATTVVGFHIKFDIHWFRILGFELDVNCKVWDCQLAEFIYSGQEDRFASLEETLKKWELPEKKRDLVKDYWDAGISTEDIPIPILEEYNIADVFPSLPALYELQQKALNDKQKQLVWLEGEDLKALADAEFNGVLWDAERANEKLSSLNDSLAEYLGHLNRYLPDGIPVHAGESCFNWDSGDHLSALLYGGTVEFKYALSEEAVYKSGPNKGEAYTKNRWRSAPVVFPQRFIPIKNTLVKKCTEPGYTGTLFYQTDAPTLMQLKTKQKENKQLLEILSKRAQALKVAEMIESIKNIMETKHWANNLVHAQFNQNNVITGRLSSSAPNMQNTPPEIDELFVSRYD